jgi:uncharacterized membrane protein YjjP (DUF1212 family)
MQSRNLLPIVLKIGSLMLEFGAEIYRVEESIYRICKAYGAKSIEVFVIPSTIILTLSMGDEDTLTLSRKVVAKETDLDKVDQLNNLSRYICENTPDIRTISEMIVVILSRKSYRKSVIYASYAVVTPVFCLFFGGNIRDAFFSMFAGLTVKYVLDILNRLNSNTIFINIICSSISSLLAIIFVKLGLADNYDKIIIGTIMLLVPGLTLTTSMRDFIMGDLIAGILRLIEALLVATGIAIGVALVLTLFGFNS